MATQTSRRAQRPPSIADRTTTERHQRTKQTREAWGGWVSTFAWSHFITLTFAFAPSEIAAARQFRRWHRRVEQRAQKPVRWFYVPERSKAGLLHVHALLDGTAGLEPAALKAAWRCGRSDVSVYNSGMGGAQYITKTLGADFDLHDIDGRPLIRAGDGAIMNA